MKTKRSVVSKQGRSELFWISVLGVALSPFEAGLIILTAVCYPRRPNRDAQ